MIALVIDNKDSNYLCKFRVIEYNKYCVKVYLSWIDDLDIHTFKRENIFLCKELIDKNNVKWKSY